MAGAVLNARDGGPAFPRLAESRPSYENGMQKNGNFHHLSEGGMTLRDYFAAKAMAALIALEPDRDRTGMDGVDFVAEGSYAIADAMLAARGDE